MTIAKKIVQPQVHCCIQQIVIIFNRKKLAALCIREGDSLEMWLVFEDAFQGACPFPKAAGGREGTYLQPTVRSWESPLLSQPRCCGTGGGPRQPGRETTDRKELPSEGTCASGFTQEACPHRSKERGPLSCSEYK